MKNILLICCCAFSLALTGQDLEADFRKMHETYNSLDSWSMEIKVTAYKDLTENGTPYTTGKTIKKGDQIYKNLEDQEIIINGEELLVIDHENGEIIIGKSGMDMIEAKPFAFKNTTCRRIGNNI